MKQIDKKTLNICLVATLTVAMLSVFVMPCWASTEYEWTSNSSLTKSQDKWDTRLWHWDWLSNETVPAEPDENNYCNWTADGTVNSRVQDSPYDDYFTAANLDQGTERLSLPASYQPPLLNLASAGSVILEADVENCHGTSWVNPQNFIGIKFDAWAVVNQEEGSVKLMTELYFIRAGSNLAWIQEYARQTFPGSDVWNYLVALDHSDFYGIYANETKYGTDSAKWSIDLKYFIQRGVNGCNEKLNASIDFDELYLSKVSFTLEAGATITTQSPACWGTIHMLKVTYSQPVCAMKTLTDGCFYVPNVATGLLKIEMLFDDSGLEGDQTGGTSPYTTISNWPNNVTNLVDWQFVKARVGEIEGSENWNYMADVDGDGAITMLDYQKVKRNIPHVGNYIYDLAGVTVVFDTGEEATPDGGYITIPNGAESFNVSRNGSPIGALITFW